jgi:glyoxylate utilization-related uncharacterized protein
VDPVRWRVIRYARTGENGDLVEERMFSDFTTVDGVTVPQQVLFRNRPENAMAMLNYESITLDPDNLSFDFSVPSGARRVELPTSGR